MNPSASTLRRTLSALLAGALVTIALPAAASAWSTNAQLVSGSLTAPTFQSSAAATNMNVSADGHYAFFISSSSALSASAPNGGLFRKNLWNDAAPLDVVVKLPALASGVQCGVAGYVSASSDGRYVAFASGENGLVASDTNGRRDVFVRDMNNPDPAPGSGAFTLVSAADGSAAAPAYTLNDLGGSGVTIPAAQNCLYGSQLPGPDSMSSDGKKVLFSNTAFTNISAVGVANSTAPGNLWARTVGANTTELITKIAYDITYGDPTIADPAQNVGDPLPDQEYFDNDPNVSIRTLTLASISGDGSSVAWSGAFARNQVAYHRGENITQNPYGTYDSLNYMYRRIADGPNAKTRRVVTWADTDDINCDPNLGGYTFVTEPTTVKENQCAGPVSRENLDPIDASIPQLTDDGRRVFLLAGLPGRNLTEFLTTYPKDLVTVDMSPGVSAKNGFRWITRATVASGADPVIAFSVSGDGTQAAVLTQRRDFSSTGLVQTGTFPATLSNAALFGIDLSAGFNSPPVEWIAHPSSSTDVPNNAIGNDFALDGNGNTLIFSSFESAFYAGHNGQEQALCVKRTGSCATAPAASAPSLKVTAPANAATVGTSVAGAYVAVGANSVTCRWDSEAVLNPCPTSPLALKSLSAGAHTFSVTASNASGSTAVVSAFTTAELPTANITSPGEGASVSSPVTASYTTAGATTVQCWFDSSGWINPCTAAPSKTLSAGAHSFSVRVTNAAGSQTFTRNFTTGTPAPGVTVNAPASGAVLASPVTATFSTTGSPTSVTCQWDAETVTTSCTSPRPAKTLTPGAHTFKVTAANTGGSTTVTNSFTVVDAAPVVTINSPASGGIVASPVAGAFTLGGGAAATVTCQWDSEAVISNCTSPLAAKSLTTGAHTLKVTATNPIGSDTKTVSFSVPELPTATIDAPAPAANIASPANASFTLGGGAATSVTCQWDAESPINACTSPLAPKNLTPGSHTLLVTASNVTGIASTSVTFTVIGAPAVSLSAPTAGTTVASPVTGTFNVGGGAASSVTCQWDSEPVIANCSSPTAAKTLAPGAHTFKVTASNVAGTDTKTVSFTVTSAPDASIGAPADGSTVASPVTANFTTSGATTVTCQWDSETVISGCVSPQGPKTLSPGSHTFKVSATNAGGITTATSTFTVIAAPTVTITSPAEGATTTSPVTADFTLGGGAAASVTCRWDSAPVISACASPQGPMTLSAGAHTFTVTAANVAGSASVARSFTVGSSPPPPPPPPAGGGTPSPSVNSLAAKIKPGAANITINVTGAGTVNAIGTAKLPKGKKLKSQTVGTGTATAGGSGDLTFTFNLNLAAKKFVKKKKKLKVAITVTFAPSSGAPIVRTLSLTFKK